MKANKAVYMTASVACGWAGAVIWGQGRQGVPYTRQHQFHVIEQERYAKTARKCRKSKRGTDRQTDRRTDEVTYRVACTRLKNENKTEKGKN